MSGTMSSEQRKALNLLRDAVGNLTSAMMVVAESSELDPQHVYLQFQSARDALTGVERVMGAAKKVGRREV